jgi:hypothetical protein
MSLSLASATTHLAFSTFALMSPAAAGFETADVRIQHQQHEGKQQVPSKLPWVNAGARQVYLLRDNWDGYGASAVSVDRLNMLTQYLDKIVPETAPVGSIVPGADGSIQAEWHLRSGSFGLLLEEGADVSAWMRPADSPREIERTGLAALDLLRAAIFHAMA